MGADADTCRTLLSDWEDARNQVKRLANPQLALIWGTVALVLAAVVLVMAQVQTLPIVTGALGLITGTAAGFVTLQLNAAQKRADGKLRTYHRECKEPAMLENLRQAM